MGLLNALSTDDAKLGIGLLAAGGYSPTPMSFGQRLAGAMQGLSADQDAELRRKLAKSQIEENAAQTAARNLQAQRDAQINSLVMSRLNRGGAAPAASGAGETGDSSMSVGVNPMGMQSPQGMNAPMGGMGGAPGVAQGGGAPSSFPLSLQDITALQALNFKGADGLFNMYKYATDGVKREAGNYYKDPISGVERYMPKLDNGMGVVNGRVAPLTGYSDANAAIKGQEAGAVAGAKFPYDVATDRARQITSAKLETKTVVGADGNLYEMPRYDVAMGQGGAFGQGGASAAAAPGGIPGAFMSGRNPITQQSATALNDNWIKNAYQPAIDSGKVAADLSANIQALRNIDMNTGWGTDQKAGAASVLEGLGIASGSAKLYASNAQKFQSVAMDKLMTTLQAQKGPQTEGDSDRAKQTFVALKNTPEANAFIMDFAQAKANMDQRRAQYYEQALPLAQRSGDLTRVDREWRKIQGSIWADPALQRWSK